MLNGIKIIDLTGVVFGPLATQIFADYGADVIKIEPPEGDVMRYAGSVQYPGMGSIFLNLNRGKKSIVLNLKTEEGKDILMRMIDQADIFVHNIRRKSIDQLGFSYNSIKKRNPKIIYCSATGFSEKNSRCDDGAIDEIIQAAAGIAAINNNESYYPQLIQTLIADKVSALGLACAILAVLYSREKTGQGCFVDVPMYESMAVFMLLEHLQGQIHEPPKGDAGYHRVMTGGRRIYRASDGFIAMTPYSKKHWVSFLTAIGKSDLALDSMITDARERNVRIHELYNLIENVAHTKSIEEWERIAKIIGFPAHGVRSLNSLSLDSELLITGAIEIREQAGVGKIRSLCSPGYFNGVPSRHPSPAPRLGEHTKEILEKLGINSNEINSLLNKGVISGVEN